MYEPIAYIYEADYHCPACALESFGHDADGDITGVDGEGNEIGVLAPWDEWMQGTGETETLACGTCGIVIDEYEVESDGSERDGPDEHDACPIHDEAYRLCGCPVPTTTEVSK